MPFRVETIEDLNVLIMVNFVNRELSILFQTELVPSLTTYNGDAKVVWLNQRLATHTHRLRKSEQGGRFEILLDGDVLGQN